MFHFVLLFKLSQSTFFKFPQLIPEKLQICIQTKFKLDYVTSSNSFTRNSFEEQKQSGANIGFFHAQWDIRVAQHIKADQAFGANLVMTLPFTYELYDGT